MANIISTILRDEGNLVEDFCVYHIALGFDQIILFDDNSVVGVAEQVKYLPNIIRNKISVFRLGKEFSELENSDGELYDHVLYKHYNYSKQMYFCNLVIRRFCSSDDWISFIDVDEFLWLPQFEDITAFRNGIVRQGFDAVVIGMWMYGHSYNIVAPKYNNICSYIWRSARLFSHGKFFAKVGALTEVKSPHIPTTLPDTKICNTLFERRTAQNDHDHELPKRAGIDTVHLKHFTIMDVVSCFQRRMRVPVSHSVPFKPTDDAWRLRVEMLKWTSACIDVKLACILINIRAQFNLDVDHHVFGLSSAIERVPQLSKLSSTLDFDYLRSRLNLSQGVDDETVLYEFFRQKRTDFDAIRFGILPSDFDAQKYKIYNGDLSHMSEIELIQHYANYGRFERRSYK